MKTQWLIILAFFAIIGCSQNENASMHPGLEQNKGGSATETTTGGTDAYSYEWADGAHETPIGFAGGTYTVSITDANSASTSQPNAPTIKMPDKIIKTGNIGLEVDDYAKAMEEIAQKVKAAQGYISSQSEQRDNYRITNNLSIRVLSQNFDGLVNGIGSMAKKLNYKNVHLQDVSEEYTDVAARLKTKREVEQRYLDILKTAKTIKDVLAVEEQLRTIREEIESSEARLKYMDDRVSYSTISLEIYQELEYNAPAPLQAGFGHKLLSALTNGWNGLLATIIGLVHIWPFLLAIAVVVVLVVRKWRKRKAAVA